EVKRNAFGLGGGDKKPITDVLLVGKKADDKGDKLYARLEGEKNVVRINAKNVETIARAVENPSVLRDRNLVQVDQLAAKADAVNVQATGDPLIKLRKDAADHQWKMFVDTGKGRKAEASSVEALLNAIATPRQVKDFLDPKATKEADLGLDKPAAVVSIWVEGVQKEEKKEDKKDEKKEDDKKKEGEKKDDKKEADKKEAEKKEADAEPKLKSEQPTVKLTFGGRDPKNKDLVYVKREAGTDV